MAERPRILVVDDSEMNRTITARQLGKLGFEADVAGSGAAALDLLFRRSYAMILVDRRMPEMDGFEFAALLREREAGASDRTPVVMMTADQPREADAARLAREFDGLLVKPVTLAQLNAVLPGRTAAPAPAAAAPADVGGEPATPFDAAALARLMGDASAATLARVAARFCEVFVEVVARLDAAAAAHDRDALEAAAHTGKGTASTAAASALAAHMEQLQALAPAGEWSAIDACCRRVHTELARARRFADALAGGRPS